MPPFADASPPLHVRPSRRWPNVLMQESITVFWTLGRSVQPDVPSPCVPHMHKWVEAYFSLLSHVPNLVSSRKCLQFIHKPVLLYFFPLLVLTTLHACFTPHWPPPSHHYLPHMQEQAGGGPLGWHRSQKYHFECKAHAISSPPSYCKNKLERDSGWMPRPVNTRTSSLWCFFFFTYPTLMTFVMPPLNAPSALPPPSHARVSRRWFVMLMHRVWLLHRAILGTQHVCSTRHASLSPLSHARVSWRWSVWLMHGVWLLHQAFFGRRWPCYTFSSGYHLLSPSFSHASMSRWSFFIVHRVYPCIKLLCDSKAQRAANAADLLSSTVYSTRYAN